MPRAQDMTPPAAVETERVLLGTILLDSEKMLLVVDIMPPGRGSWFFRDSHHLIYDAMLTLYERHDPIDLQTVTDVLYRRGQLEKVGGSSYLAELTELVVTTVNVEHHAGILREKALYRTLINLSTSISSSAYQQEDLTGILDQAQQSLLQVASSQTSSSFTGMTNLMQETIHEVENAGEHDLTGIRSGFHRLDSITSGFQPSDLIIVAARPAMGKSSLGLQFAVAAAELSNNLPVVVFSLEMSKGQLAMRMLCSEAQIDSARVRRGFLNRNEFGQLMNGAERLRQLPILVDDTPSLSVLDIRTRTKRLQMDHGIAMIVIDYLQLLTATRRKENRQQEVSDISRDLKILAKELNVPVIALSQLSRAVESRDPPIPMLSDLRDSGAIEQDADVVMFIYREDVYNSDSDPEARLIIAKQRNGPVGEVRLVFNKTFARFENLTHDHQRQPYGRVADE